MHTVELLEIVGLLNVALIMDVIGRDDIDGCENDGDQSEDYWQELKQ